MRMGSLVVALVLAAPVLAATQARAQDIQDRTIRFGHLNNTDHPVSMGVRKFAEILLEKSGGKLKVKEFPSNQLGSEMQQQSAVRGGTQEMSAPATTSLVGIVKDFGMVDFPFIVSNGRQADALLDGPFGIALAYWDLGFRNVTNSKRAIARMEDLNGLKLRVIPNPVFIETFKALGANPLPLSFSELYPALEQKTIDGQENPYSVILSNKFYEVQKFVSGTNHVYAANIIIVSKKFWDKLSPAEQKLMQDAAIEARNYERQVSRAAADKAVAELKTHGMAVNEVAPAERERMRTAVKPVTEKFLTEYDPTLVKLYKSELDRVQQIK
jgi:tripartite ATP-independent transporter DctP family solute receptor